MLQRMLLLLLPAVAFGQLTPNSVTVSANRNANLTPDQVILGVDLTGPTSTTRDDAVAALDGTGITAANYSSVRTSQTYSGSQPQTVIVWSFSLTVDFSAMKDTLAQLSAAQARLATKNNGLSMAYSVNGTQVSARLAQQTQCVLADLISDARAQAQKLASAAGMSLGSILALSSTASPTGSTAVPVCTLTAKFALGAF